ncbi:MAG: TolC family protein [Sphingobacteriales bacterium]|nr:MAG: TolC family protein [Sphingobacteriales bacterium]
MNIITLDKSKRYLGLLAVVAFLATGCSSMRIVSMPPDMQVPTDFASNHTVHGDNTVSKSRVFADPFLVQLVDIAVKQNQDVQIAMQRIEAARSFFKMRKGAMLPSVEAAASASAQRYGDYTMEGVGNFDTNLSGNISEDQKIALPIVPYYYLGLRSSWEIDLWGKLRNQKHAAYMRLLGAEQGRNLVVTSLVAEVASRYYDLVALDEELGILQKNMSLQDSAVRVAEVQKEAGRANELGVQQFRAQLLRTRSLLLQTEQDIVRTENELNYLLGRFPQPVPRTKSFMDQPLPATMVAGLPQDIMNRRPDVVQAELELKATQADVAAAKAAFLPSLTLAPFFGYNAFNSALLFNPGSLAYGVIGGLAAPLLNRSATKGNLTRSEAEKMEAYYRYNRTVINAFQEVQTTLTNMQNLRRIYDLNQQETQVLSDAIGTSNELFKVGYANYLDVITAQRNALEAEINQVETKKSLYISLITLYRSSGGGW